MRAGELLLTEGHANAAASRIYYSLYQAGVFVLETKHNLKPTKFKANPKGWEHAMVRDNASLVRDKPEDRALYTKFLNMRIEADYQPSSVELERVSDRLKDVRALVEEVTK